ncbi:hypothetical protein F52700_6209 [Fusarium sp. NRRL 52700]|nr:hypothetical protein F52700_6209 [Fusarium sp. NRRL 52700]
MGSITETDSLLKQAFADSDGTIRTLASQVEERMKGDADDMIVDIGPVFGELNAKTVGTLDDNLLIVIAGMTKSIAKIPVKDRTYEKTVALFSQSPLVQVEGTGVSKSDSLIKQDSAAFHTNGSPDAKIVKEVANWFRKFIDDQGILDATNIDINVLGNIVAQSGAIAKDLTTAFQTKEKAAKSLDIAGIRYPEPGRPMFSIFRVHLTAWSDCTQSLLEHKDSNGITGEFYQTDYVPRKATLDGLKDEVRQKAVEAAKALFQD